jgi:plasmid stabilization system protein ParE
LNIIWGSDSLADIARLHRFVAVGDPDAARQIVEHILSAPEKLREFTRLGERLEVYTPREVRKLIVGRYEMRYEILPDMIFILRIWHVRENRPG